jgi:hypothetical protein
MGIRTGGDEARSQYVETALSSYTPRYAAPTELPAIWTTLTIKMLLLRSWQHT